MYLCFYKEYVQNRAVGRSVIPIFLFRPKILCQQNSKTALYDGAAVFPTEASFLSLSLSF